MTQINGMVADEFGAVADAFERNFAEHGELVAAFSRYVDGEAEVDIWAGVRGAPGSHRCGEVPGVG